MTKLKVIPRPKRKDYESQTWMTEWSNAQNPNSKFKLVSLDKMGYIEHLENYAKYLEELVKQLE